MYPHAGIVRPRREFGDRVELLGREFLRSVGRRIWRFGDDFLVRFRALDFRKERFRIADPLNPQFRYVGRCGLARGLPATAFRARSSSEGPSAAVAASIGYKQTSAKNTPRRRRRNPGPDEMHDAQHDRGFSGNQQERSSDFLLLWTTNGNRTSVCFRDIHPDGGRSVRTPSFYPRRLWIQSPAVWVYLGAEGREECFTRRRGDAEEKRKEERREREEREPRIEHGRNTDKKQLLSIRVSSVFDPWPPCSCGPSREAASRRSG